ncbi:exosortase B [Derxia lacustris]|uniref:exosortase B n=1 Tax=Derxia lacustris TaxID=764842 RepID=UPI000A16E658|nr:exosortase B [Derxia lacustris]
MSARLPAGGPSVLPLAAFGIGFAALYVPSLLDLSRSLWDSSEQSQGPLVLAVALWLLAQRWRALPAVAPADGGAVWPGWPLLALGLALYALGRSQGILVFELGSLIVLLAAAIVLLRGLRTLRHFVFPLCFLLFMIPLPGAVVAALTQPMKSAVSGAVVALLQPLGYPVARSGVIISIGQYDLLVADACAGLQTLFSLESLGLLYLDQVRHPSRARSVALALLVFPIGFVANVVRVAVLALVTFHLGDAAGQGFLHGLAGMLLFLCALLLIIAADSLLRRLLPGRPALHAAGRA